VIQTARIATSSAVDGTRTEPVPPGADRIYPLKRSR
jgi:hypothetical protein